MQAADPSAIDGRMAKLGIDPTRKGSHRADWAISATAEVTLHRVRVTLVRCLGKPRVASRLPTALDALGGPQKEIRTRRQLELELEDLMTARSAEEMVGHRDHAEAPSALCPRRRRRDRWGHHGRHGSHCSPPGGSGCAAGRPRVLRSERLRRAHVGNVQLLQAGGRLGVLAKQPWGHDGE